MAFACAMLNQTSRCATAKASGLEIAAATVGAFMEPAIQSPATAIVTTDGLARYATWNARGPVCATITAPVLSLTTGMKSRASAISTTSDLDQIIFARTTARQMPATIMVNAVALQVNAVAMQASSAVIAQGTAIRFRRACMKGLVPICSLRQTFDAVVPLDGLVERAARTSTNALQTRTLAMQTKGFGAGTRPVVLNAPAGTAG